MTTRRASQYAAKVKAVPQQPRRPRMPKLFREGWEHGYSDGGEHDCRMFEPTAQRAWEDHLRAKERRTT